jgi:hypothetical protein
VTRSRVLLLVGGLVVLLTIGWLVWPDRHDAEVARTTDTAPSLPTTRPTTTTSSTTTTAQPTTTPTTTTPTTTSAPPTSAPTTTSLAPTTTAPPPPPPPPTTTPPVLAGDRSVYVLGDSALLGASAEVPAALAGWDVTFDAVGSRRLIQAIEVLKAHRQEIGAVVVIQMGNNYIEGEGGSFAAQIDEAMSVLSGVPRVVWLTVAERWPSRVALNEAIRATPGRWANAVVGDWAALVASHPEYAADQLHLSDAGAAAIAQLIGSLVGPPPG